MVDLVLKDSQVYTPDISCLSTSLEVSIKTEDGFAKQQNNGPQGAYGADHSLQMPWLENGDEVLKKLDSLDRWMQRELPVENKTSPLTPSANSYSVLDTIMYEDKNTDDGWQPHVTKETTPPCVLQLFFEITDYSPTWSFSTESSKVLLFNLELLLAMYLSMSY